MVLDAVGWALFLIWIGVVLLIKALPDGAGGIGVSVIIFGGALVRFFLRVSVSSFWLIIGSVFLSGGLGEMIGIGLPFLPSSLIVCGVLLLFHQKSKKHKIH